MKRTMMMAAMLLLAIVVSAQKPEDVLNTTRRANKYFMEKYADPTQPTFVKRVRPSSLWTRAVYYEGLMELLKIDPQQQYIDYAMKWAEFHKWTPRNGVKTTDADDQCCGQTYINLLPYTKTGDKGVLANLFQNLDNQMATGRHNYWTWIDAIQMAMPLYALQWSLIDGQETNVEEVFSTRRTDSGGAMPTLSRPIRKKMAMTVLGAVVTDGYMLPLFV